MSTRVPHETPTDTFPIPQRTAVRVFRQITRSTLALFRDLGARVFYTLDVGRATADVRTWGPLVVNQMRNIGVDSVPLTAIVAAFIGAVTAYQTVYQIFPGVQMSAVSWIVRQSVLLELAPLLTALVLTGRVGARMTAEIGTMRVTEQVDALETLAYDPIAYLVVPRLLAALIMFPLLTLVADAVGLGSGFLTAVLATKVTRTDFVEGLRLTFSTFQVTYGIIKAVLFGGAISLVCTYEGYMAGTGSEGVGRSTAKAVVIASVMILLLDALTALYLAPQLQS